VNKLINERELLEEFYPSCIDNGSKRFSIICQDPKTSVGSMIVWPELNFLFSTDGRIHFIYIGADVSNSNSKVLDEVDVYFGSKSLQPLILFKKVDSDHLNYIGMFYVLARTSERKTLGHFKTINSNIRQGYELQEVLTLVEENYFLENRSKVPRFEMSEQMRKQIDLIKTKLIPKKQ
jgi:hypothetical protein